jgi:The  BURPS668_1122 family of deaminases
MGINSDPVTLHKYLYANADPVTYTDPTGNFSLGGVMATINIASTLVSTAQSALDLYGDVTSGEPIRPSQVGMLALAPLGGFKLFKVIGKKFLNKIGCQKPSSKNPICNIFKSDKARVDLIRKNLLVGVSKKKRRTIAFADYFGQSSPAFGTMWAVSGRVSPLGSEPAPAAPILGSFYARPVFGDKDKNGRRTDAEKKLFESLAKKFSPGSSGLVRMHASKAICGSCQGVKQQFKRRYPKVIVLGP